MNDDDELNKIEQTAREVLAAVHTVADQITPAANARAMLIGVAAIMISRNLRDGQEPDAAAVNAAWAKENFPWRMVRSLQ